MSTEKQQLQPGYTYEQEYQEKMNELIKVNNDLDNLLVTAQIGALYIDNHSRIRRVTPIMTKNTNLSLVDTGKKITEVDFMAGYHTFVEDVNKCIQEKCIVWREVAGENGTWGLRFCPYYLQNGDIDGIIIILFDVTKMLDSVKKEIVTLANSIPGFVARMRYDDGLIIESANEAMYEMMQRTREEVVNEYENHYERVIYPRDWVKMQSKIEYCINSGEMMQMEYRVTNGLGAEEWRLMQALPLEGGEKPALQCVIIDITDSKQAYLQLRQERKKLNIIAMMSGDLIFEYDVKRDFVAYTKQGDELINDEQFKENYTEFIRNSGYFHPDDSEILEQFCESLRNGTPRIHVELRKRYKDGQYHWIEIEGVTIFNEKGVPEKVIGKTQNIDERKEREREFREKSEKDSLTGLLNHRTTREQINERLMKLKGEEKAYLMIADIDNFKQVNDINGHLFGDAVICAFADKLKEVFPGAIKGRIGGDEFLMLVEGIDSVELEYLLEELQEGFQAIYQEGDSGMKISCSCGLVCCDKRHKESEKLFQWADFALYQVKGKQKGTYIIVQAGDGPVPQNGYLNQRGIDEDYSRKDTLIQNAEELILFSLELLDNVADIRNGLKMVSDRICQFFEFDDIVSIQELSVDKHDVVYHWSNKQKRLVKNSSLTEDMSDWKYIENHCDHQGVMILRRREMEKMQGETVGSIMFVKAKGFGTYHGYMAFIDRKNDRDWEQEKDVLYRLANVIFNRLQNLFETEEQKQQMERQINYDALTKLPQYFRFMELSEQYCRENPEKKYYFVYSDFSNFQYLNEVYGFSEGDKVLQDFAVYLSNKCKYGIYHTRVTSDHFISLLTGDDLEQISNDFLEQMRFFCQENNSRYEHCNLCIISGISELKMEYESVSSAVDGANIARKNGKESMETAIVIYSDKMKSKNDEEKALVARMTEAMEKDEFKAFIQPKISLETGEIIGGEALVRWIREDGSMVYPDKFIPVFEKNGFITKVDFRVLEQVLAYLQDAAMIGERVVPISVNFSRRHNEEITFTNKVAEYLEKYETPKGMLEAELTESVFMLDLSELKENIKKLHDLGVVISIDDFGSGYSSLNVLANISADIIKMDRKFFDFTTDQKRNKEFIQSLITMMKQMGMKTVMEGVETKEQMEFIKKCGCDIAQGYYYARPMPLADFRKFLKEFEGPK